MFYCYLHVCHVIIPLSPSPTLFYFLPLSSPLFLVHRNSMSSLPLPFLSSSLPTLTSLQFSCFSPLSSHPSPLFMHLRGKRKLQLEHIKEELRYPWLDLRKSIGPPSESDMFTTITGTCMCWRCTVLARRQSVTQAPLFMGAQTVKYLHLNLHLHLLLHLHVKCTPFQKDEHLFWI